MQYWREGEEHLVFCAVHQRVIYVLGDSLVNSSNSQGPQLQRSYANRMASPVFIVGIDIPSNHGSSFGGVPKLLE